MNQNKTGLILGLFAAFIHLVWSVFVLLGWAQPLLNFIYSMHSLSNPFVVAPFSLGRSLGLIVIAFIMGYIIGSIFSFIWNKIHTTG